MISYSVDNHTLTTYGTHGNRCVTMNHEGVKMITLALSEILNRLGCPQWDRWCEQHNINSWACAEGYGHTTYTMAIEEAREWGII